MTKRTIKLTVNKDDVRQGNSPHDLVYGPRMGLVLTVDDKEYEGDFLPFGDIRWPLSGFDLDNEPEASRIMSEAASVSWEEDVCSDEDCTGYIKGVDGEYVEFGDGPCGLYHTEITPDFVATELQNEFEEAVGFSEEFELG